MAVLSAAIAALLAVALVVREQTWRRSTEALRARLAETAAAVREQNQRADAAREMSTLAQELKSPLQGVLGNAELMLASAVLNPAAADDLRDIRENASRAAGIVRNLVAFTDTHALTRRWQDINALASHAADEVRSARRGPSGVVTLTFSERLPLVYIDGRQLEKVIATLLSRPAVDGNRRASRSPLIVTTHLKPPGDTVVIELDDPSSEFEPEAWQSDLAACRRVVEAHGGTLAIFRGGEPGFRFELELPVAAIGADAAPV